MWLHVVIITVVPITNSAAINPIVPYVFGFTLISSFSSIKFIGQYCSIIRSSNLVSKSFLTGGAGVGVGLGFNSHSLSMIAPLSSNSSNKSSSLFTSSKLLFIFLIW